MRIGIVGQGYVGTAVKTVFEKHYKTIKQTIKQTIKTKYAIKPYYLNTKSNYIVHIYCIYSIHIQYKQYTYIYIVSTV